MSLTVVFTAPVVSSVELDKTAFTIAPKAEDVDTGAFIIDSKSCEFINDGYNCFKAESHSVSMGKVKYTLIPIEEKEWKENKALIPVKMKKKFFIDYVREKNYEKVKELMKDPATYDETAIARYGDRTMIDMYMKTNKQNTHYFFKYMIEYRNPTILECLDDIMGLMKPNSANSFDFYFQVFCSSDFDIFKAFWRQFGTPENLKDTYTYGLRFDLNANGNKIIDPKIMQFLYNEIVLPVKSAEMHARNIEKLHKLCGSPACIKYLMDIKVFDRSLLGENNKWILNPDYVILFPCLEDDYFKFPYEGIKDCIEVILQGERTFSTWRICHYYRKYNYYKHKELLERLFKEIPPTETDMYYMKYVNTE